MNVEILDGQKTIHTIESKRGVRTELLVPVEGQSFPVVAPQLQPDGSLRPEPIAVSLIQQSLTEATPIGPNGIGILYHLTKAQADVMKPLGFTEAGRWLKMYATAYDDFKQLCQDNNIDPVSLLKEPHKVTPIEVLNGLFESKGMPEEDKLFAIAKQFVALFESPAQYLEYFYEVKYKLSTYNEHVVQRLGLDPTKYNRQQVMRKLLDAPDSSDLLRELYPFSPPPKEGVSPEEYQMRNDEYQIGMRQFIDDIEKLLDMSRMLSLNLSYCAPWVRFTRETMNPRDNTEGWVTQVKNLFRRTASGEVEPLESRRAKRNRATRFPTEAFGKSIYSNTLGNTTEVALKLQAILATGVPQEFFKAYVDLGKHQLSTISTQTNAPISARIDGETMKAIFPPRVVIFDGDECVFGKQDVGSETAQVHIHRHDHHGFDSTTEYANDKIHLQLKNARMENCPAPLMVDIDIYNEGGIKPDTVGLLVTTDHRLTNGNEVANYVVTQLMEQLAILHRTYDIPLLPRREGVSSIRDRLLAALPPVEVFEKFKDIDNTPWSFALPAGSAVKFRELAKEYFPDFDMGVGSLLTALYGDIVKEIQAKRTQRIKKDVTVGTLVSSTVMDTQLKMSNVSDLLFMGQMRDWIRIINGKLEIDPLIKKQQKEFASAVKDDSSKRNQLRTIENVFRLPMATWAFNAFASLHPPLNENGRKEVGEITFSVLNIKTPDRIKAWDKYHQKAKVRVLCGPAFIPEWTQMAFTGDNVEEDGLVPFVIKMQGDQREVRKVLVELIERVSDLDQENLKYLKELENGLKQLKSTA